VNSGLTTEPVDSFSAKAMKKLILSAVLAAFALSAVAPSLEAAPIVKRAFTPVADAKPKAKKKKKHQKKKKRHGKRKL